MSIPAYSSYKDSGVEWLNEVPSHWTPTRTRFLANLNPSKSEVVELEADAEVSFLPMEAISEAGEISLDQTRAISSVVAGYTYFRDGDVTIAKITPCFENGKGAIMRGLVGGIGFGTTELIVVRPRADHTTSEYLNWVFRSTAFRALGEASMYGAGGQKRVPDNFVRDFRVPLPPLHEQTAIADFLDRETDKIDALVEEQRRLIALLKEKRQAVISHAVTKGLNPDVPMKDSGIEWLGEVPAHWEVGPVKRIARVLPGYAFTAAEFSQDSRDCRLLRGINLSPQGLRWDDETVYWKRSENDGLAGWELAEGDLVVGMDRPWIGDGLRAAMVTKSDLPCLLLQRVASLRAADEVDGRFLLRCFQHDAFYHHCAPDLTGVSVPHLSGGQIESFVIPVPPLDESRAIADFIDDQIWRFAKLADDAELAIALLQERRAALISAAVTGKIDVRGLVAPATEMEAA